MQYNRLYDFRQGENIIADQIDNELAEIQGVINGNIGADNLTSGCIDSGKLVSSVNPETRDAEIFSDFVASGLYVSYTGYPGAAGANILTATVDSGIAYIAGKRVNKSSQAITFEASKDTYIDMDSSGTLYYTGLQVVANGATAPALAGGRIRLACVKTDSTHITATLTGRILAGAKNGMGLTVARPINPALYNSTAFHAWKSSQTSNNDGDIILFETETLDVGSNFNVATGKYTCPYDGIYHFNTTVGIGGAAFYCFAHIDNLTQNTCIGESSLEYTNTQRMHTAGIAYCRKGDEIAVKIYEAYSGAVAVLAYTGYNFNGIMIGQ